MILCQKMVDSVDSTLKAIDNLNLYPKKTDLITLEEKILKYTDTAIVSNKSLPQNALTALETSVKSLEDKLLIIETKINEMEKKFDKLFLSLESKFVRQDNMTSILKEANVLRKEETSSYMDLLGYIKRDVLDLEINKYVRVSELESRNVNLKFTKESKVSSLIS